MDNPLISIQCDLSAGELSPSLYGRTDLKKWQAGTSTCRNFFADYRGGVTSRPGTSYVGTSRQCGNCDPPRLIPFSFNINQGFILEFGNQYMRVIFDGAYVTEECENITAATNANPGVFTVPSHGYSVGDWVYITDVEGMTELNGLTWIISTVPDANTFTLIDLFDNSIDTTLWNAYVAGGMTARIYTVSSPYFSEDLPYLKFTQSADTMTICCINTDTNTEYVSYELERFSDTDWVFTAVTNAAAIGYPGDVHARALSSSLRTTYYSYVVTAVNSVTGEESNPSHAAVALNNDISVYQGTNSISWNPVSGATSYNIYAATPSYGYPVVDGNLYGYIGTSVGTNFTDTNTIPDFTVVPPQHFDPFARGAITQIIPGGSQNGNYSQQTVGFSITTSTGSGFAGEPVVTDGDITGFVITNQGENYQPTDTITFTDSGGGVATGTYTFTENGNPTQYAVFNGVQLTIQAENDYALGPYEIYQGFTLAITLTNFVQWLNASTQGNINIASYDSDDTHIYVTYNTPGVVGNAYGMAVGPEWSGASVSGDTLSGGGVDGSGATGTLTVGPATGTYPSCVAYYQQRRVYANSLNNPDTYWMSQPGLFSNMDTSIPTTDADALSGTPWSQQVNGISWLIPMPNNQGSTGMVTLTGNGAWQVTGGSSAAITPSNQIAIPQAFNGCNNLVPPITVNYDILYVQAKGSIVRDLAYSFFLNIYTGRDLTVFSDHLFLNNQITQWAWAEEPFKLVWAVRDDGTLLCLTYLKESNGYVDSSDVYAWTRHDTNGLFYSVASVTEPPIDAVYFVVSRFVNGQWRYYIERLADRLWVNIQQAFCVDCGLSTTAPSPNAQGPS